jgi:hypothetical protein
MNGESVMVPGVKMRTRVIEIVLVAALVFRCVGLAVAFDTIRFNIPAEEAPAAIRDFASQANVQIIAAGESVNGKRLHAVAGELSIEQALRLLLAGSGLTPRYVGNGSIALVTDTTPVPSGSVPAGAPRPSESHRSTALPPEQGSVEKAAKPASEVTIQAKREREKIQHEVSQFASAAITHEWGRPMLRWTTRICPLVAGLPREQGEFVLSRLSQDIRDARAPLAPEKCTANLLILVTPEPEELLEKLRKKQHRVFSRCRTGEGAVLHFLKTDRPVRVWYNWEYSAGDVSPYGVLALADLQEEIGGCATVIAGTNSRLTYGALRSIDTEIIAVDLSRMQGVNMGQLTDYIAMISLAEIDLDERVANVPTILRLFDASGDAPTEGMSLWDKALLRALYAAPETDVMWLSQVKSRAADIIVPR